VARRYGGALDESMRPDQGNPAKAISPLSIFDLE
jgi:hypothetical protein